MTEPGAVPVYGNWRKPRSAGLGRFGAAVTALIFIGGVIVASVMFLVGPLEALVVLLPIAAIIGAASFEDRHGKTLLNRSIAMFAFKRAQRARTNLYRSGPLGRTPRGRFQLPGLAARSELIEATDAYGQPFAVIHLPTTRHFTVVIECQPDGAALVDDEQVDEWVAQWGGWLAARTQEPNIIGATVTVETAPDTGARLRNEVLLNQSPHAPELAARMLEETLATFPAGAASVRAFVSLTFKGTSASGKERGVDEMIRDLSSRLPQFVEGLRETGAGFAEAMTADDLCEVVRVAFDPVSAPLFDEARQTGQRVELDWSDVGPAAHEAGWTLYRHDSAISSSWTMSIAPRGVVHSNIINRLLAPDPNIDRKRVTLTYKLLSPEHSGRIAEQDKNAAQTRLGRPRTTARHRIEAAAAARTEQEEARGAGLVAFGMIVTATISDPERMDDVKATVDGLAASSRLRLRPAYGSQDVAFSAGLPIGLVLREHQKVPTLIQEGQ